ncbi:Protein root UVB sensitive 5 [Linum perenne]
MTHSLRLSFPSSAFESSTSSLRRRAPGFRFPCFSTQTNSEDDSIPCRKQSILVERYSNGAIKRYILDDGSGVRSSFEEDLVTDYELQGSFQGEGKERPWPLPRVVADFVLPAGYPGSVSDDYLQYMLLQFPTNVTGWICHALVTSSLLKACDTNSAILPVLITLATPHDGCRLLVLATLQGRLQLLQLLQSGGRFGNLFDDDPKQWRMYADFIGSAGSIFDLTTQLYPGYFLPLASLGNLTKAVARGLKDPSSRVIQNHFAACGNLGEVAAKEEVWEVGAQLLGLALGILILDTPGLVKSFPVLTLTWTSTRLLHLWLRYQSLSVLQFDTINLKRARLLVNSHIVHSRVQGCLECNKEENILLWERFTKPRITFGVPLGEMIGAKKSISEVKALMKVYENEKYLLMVNRETRDFEVFISFKVGATSISVLRSVWQTYWLHLNWQHSLDVFHQLAASQKETQTMFEDFIQQLAQAGWDTNQMNLKVPVGLLIDESSLI